MIEMSHPNENQQYESPADSNGKLRELIEQSGLTQTDALALINGGQAFCIALSTWKSYLAAPVSARRRRCPQDVLERAIKKLAKFKK